MTSVNTGPVDAWRRLCPGLYDDSDVLKNLVNLIDDSVTESALAEFELSGVYPETVLAELRSHGLAEAFVPERANSLEMGALCSSIAAKSGSLAITVGVNGLALLPIYISGSPEQCALVAKRLRSGSSAALLLSEYEHGSDLLATEAFASQRGESFVLDGEKQLINGGSRHSVLVALMRTRKSEITNGSVARVGGLSLFLLERGHGVEALPRWRTLPVRAADISGVRFNSFPAPRDAVIGQVGAGFPLIQKTLTISRGLVGSLASGTVSGALRLAIGYASERNVHGRPISELGAINEHLVRMYAFDLTVGAMAIKAAYMINSYGVGAGYYSTVAKYVCCRLAEEAVAEGRHVLGARALLETVGYSKFVRDVLLYGTFDGTSHLMLEGLGRYLIRMGKRTDCSSFSEVYESGPRPIRKVAERQHMMPVSSVGSRFRHLASVFNHESIAALGEFGDVLTGLVGKASAAGLWKQDQAFRFEAGAVLAEFEALLAVWEVMATCRSPAKTWLRTCRVDLFAAEYASNLLARRSLVRLGALAEQVHSDEIELALEKLSVPPIDPKTRDYLKAYVAADRSHPQ